MTMSRFRAAPNENHYSMLGQILGYLRHTKDAAIRFRTEIPDYSHYPETKYDWDESIYRGIEEDIPDDAPPPKGKAVRISTYVDENLLHCRATGRSASGILHFINSTPVDWFSKMQIQSRQQLMDLSLWLLD